MIVIPVSRFLFDLHCRDFIVFFFFLAVFPLHFLDYGNEPRD